MTGLQFDIHPCAACGFQLEARNLTCPRCGRVAEAVALAAIDRRHLNGLERLAFLNGEAACRAHYQKDETYDIDPADYHPAPGFEDHYRAGWQWAADHNEGSTFLGRFWRSRFGYGYSERSIFELVADGQVTAEVHGVQRLREMIVSGELTSSSMVRPARDADGLYLDHERFPAAPLPDVARKDLRLDSLFRPVSSFAFRGIRWGLKIGLFLATLLSTYIVFVQGNPIYALAFLVCSAIVFFGDYSAQLPVPLFVIIAGLKFIPDLAIPLAIGVILPGAAIGLPGGAAAAAIYALSTSRNRPVAASGVTEKRSRVILWSVVLPLIWLVYFALFLSRLLAFTGFLTPRPGA